MPGYLDNYGAGEERRNRVIFRSVAAAVVITVVASLSCYLLKNHHQESVVRSFLSALRDRDYQRAYRDWGCTAEKPCSGYAFEKFQSDWGPAAKGGAPDPSILRIADSESCSSGVLLTVEVNSGREEKLWVDKSKDKSNDAIGFAPYPICPHKSPFAIMLHRTIGKLRKPLLR
ncbi:MAG: hypothetical protein M3N93_05770 [Acidobacteriota bacterium]|nr:hypothetical protein [Acidobacteriota bacterium]